jgi:leucyl aminopeptidase
MLKHKLNISCEIAALENLQTEGLVVGVFESQKPSSPVWNKLNELFGGLPSRLLESGEIKGELKEFHVLHNVQGKIAKIIVLGCGKAEKFNQDTVRFIAAKGARTARKLGQKEVAFLLETFNCADEKTMACSVAEGLIMGLDRFENYKSKKKCDDDELQKIVLLPAAGADVEKFNSGLERGRILAEGTVLARDISNHPGNYMTPTHLAEEARKVAEQYNLPYTVMDEPELIEKGFQGITAVSQGSAENCKLIIMDYKGRQSSEDIDLAIVGKGLTFDAGGISIKPSEGMHLMKYDMCGSAAVIGAVSAIARMKPSINVRFYIPSSENLNGSRAYKPGDILKMYGGKTVEVVNTDAEGRLLMADAIAYAKEQGAKRIIDIATLTGAVVVGLGHVRTGLLGSDEKLINTIKSASEECGEKLWQLPLDEEYKVSLKSVHADLSNSGGRAGGTISAAVFLNEFAGGLPYCHLDIAGTAWVENAPTQYSAKPYLPREGATGTGARTLTLTVEALAGQL